MRVLYSCMVAPTYIFCVLLWLGNDLYGKNLFHNWWTGKISDVTSLFVFPFFVSVCLKALPIFRNVKDKALFSLSVFATGLVFFLINVKQSWNDLFTKFFWGTNAVGYADVSDLFCMLSLPLCFYFYNNKRRNLSLAKNTIPKKYAVLLSLVFVGFASINTSAPRQPHRQDATSLFWFFLASENDAVDSIVFQSPTKNYSLASGEALEFRWQYNGYYLGDDPSLANQSERCAEGYSQKAYLWEFGGTFQEYYLQIYQNGRDTEREYYRGKPLYSFRTQQLSQSLHVDLPDGEYLSLVSLVFYNRADCQTPEVEYFPIQQLAVPALAEKITEPISTKETDSLALVAAASSPSDRIDSYFQVKNDISQVEFQSPSQNQAFSTSEEVTFSWQYQKHKIQRSSLETICPNEEITE
ncbi:MAG: hypothetical protein AAF518_25685 [Spirochaetota bacterium]